MCAVRGLFRTGSRRAGSANRNCAGIEFPTYFSRDKIGGNGKGRLFVPTDWRLNGAVVCTVKDEEFQLMRSDGENLVPFEAPEKQSIYLLAMAK